MGNKALDHDIVRYPAEDHMGEHELQTWLSVNLWRAVQRYLQQRKRIVRSGHDQFFYWSKGDPTQGIAPDEKSNLVLAHSTNDPTVYSETLGCWLRRVVGEDGKPLVRVALDENGDSLVSTDDEAVRDALERAEAEARRAEAEAQRAEAAERELAALRARLASREK